MDNEKIVIEKHGQKIECDVLFTFDSEDTCKSYIGYTDNSIGTNGRKNIYVSAFDPIAGEGSLEDITTEAELDMVRRVLEQLDQESKEMK